MKRLVQLLAGVLGLAIAVAPAAAQRSDNLEFNGFGSFLRFDRAFQLKSQPGGGVRVGYNLSDRVGLEIVGDYVRTTDLAATTNVSVQALSANVVLTYPMGKRSTIYATGGFTRAVFGVPYDFTENMVDGGVGTRMFIGKHLALRADARAMYTPSTKLPGGTWGGQVVGSAGLSYFFVPPQHGAVRGLRAGHLPHRRERGDGRSRLLGVLGRPRLPRCHVPRHAPPHVRRPRLPRAEGDRAVCGRRIRPDAGTEPRRGLLELHHAVGSRGSVGPGARCVEQSVLLAHGRLADQLLDEAERVRALP